MITIFPALTSSTVNPNALPGIVKALEKFTIVYRLDEIVGAFSSLQATAKGAMILAGTQYELVSQILMEVKADRGGLRPGDFDRGRTRSGGKFSRDEEKEILKKQLDVIATDLGKHVDIKTPRFDTALSVEPTYLQVDRPFFGSTLVGVKVIPFQVKSDKRLAQLISNDRVSYGLKQMFDKYKRLAVSTFHGAVNKLKIPFLAGGTVSGDVRKDILYASSEHWKNTFVVLNYMDLESDEFTTSPAGIKKLHDMGWSSLIFADDVNKRAIFCMKEFNGLCSTIQYPYLFASLGGEQAKVYKDMEDIKASASPIFKMTTSMSKISQDIRGKVL